jgi:serine/threonine-protein kinase
MELLEGESLATRLKRVRRIREASIAEIVRQICGTVGAAHAANIIHRDLKPDNIFLVPDAMLPGGVRVKVLDFGIAKLIGAESMQKTRTGAVIGTPMYMSPEQARGNSNVDARADIYSLGCIVFEMAAGRPPYVGAGAGDVLAAHIHEPVPPLDPAELSPRFGMLVMRMMAKKPDDRPATMQAVLDEMEGRIQPKPITPEAVSGTLAGLGPRPPSGAGMQPMPMIPSPPSQADLDRAGRPRPSGAVSTTLGQSVGELSYIDSTVAPSSGGRQKLILVGAVAAGIALGVGAVLWLRGPRHHTEIVPTAAPPPLAPQPAAPATVKLHIESVPAGAEVFKLDGARAGVTPLVDEVARGAGSSAYVVKLKGYNDLRVSLPDDADGSVTARLVAKKKKPHESDAIVDPFAPQ